MMFAPAFRSPLKAGFTLIELSIVLVIVGLIIGGVLVGRDLITAATIRSQISQIEKYQAAVNTFRGKYGFLPGDIPDPAASQQGLAPRGQWPGEGDGNGMIEGTVNCGAGGNFGAASGGGEPVVFWNDLSYANGANSNLIEGSFHVSAGGCAGIASGYSGSFVTGTAIDSWFPKAKIGRGNYIYVWNGGPNWSVNVNDGQNYFGISAVNGITTCCIQNSTPAMTVAEAYNIDKKMDDGLPQSGSVKALYNTRYNTLGAYQGIGWADGSGNLGASPGTAASPTSLTCYDNSGNANSPMQYSMGQNNGSGLNCALSFRFQ